MHQFDEELITEVFEKMFSFIENEDTVIGYDVRIGEFTTKSAYRDELEKRAGDIEAGNYISHEDLKKDMEIW